MENLPRLLEKYIKSQKFPGIEWIIKLNEKKYSGCIGYLNLENKKKLNENCSYRIWSMTKPIISIVIFSSLLFGTSIIKNQTREIEKKIFLRLGLHF